MSLSYTLVLMFALTLVLTAALAPTPVFAKVPHVTYQNVLSQVLAVKDSSTRVRSCVMSMNKQNRIRRLACARGPCGLAITDQVLLDPRPLYPPVSSEKNKPVDVQRSAETLLRQDIMGTTCSCDDVFDIERKLSKLQEHHRDVTRRTLRLEQILSDLLLTLQSADDVALLERQTCNALVYNENLTTTRPLRLLREELGRMQTKWSL